MWVLYFVTTQNDILNSNPWFTVLVWVIIGIGNKWKYVFFVDWTLVSLLFNSIKADVFLIMQDLFRLLIIQMEDKCPMVLCHDLGRLDSSNKQIRHCIVCASYLFVFMSNSLGKTNTVTTQINDLLKQVCSHVMYMLQHHNKKNPQIFSWHHSFLHLSH